MKKYIQINDENSKLFGHRILNSTLSLYLGFIQLLVCFWSLSQHFYSLYTFRKILYCDFSPNSTLPPFLTAVDAIIFDIGLFHNLWGITGCVAQHLDGGYGRFAWCISHSFCLLFCLPFAFVKRPKPYQLWPLLIQQSAYGIGMLILSLAALPRVLPTFMGDLSNASMHAILFYMVGTLMNFFLLYIYWHWYWHVEEMFNSARKLHHDQILRNHNTRTAHITQSVNYSNFIGKTLYPSQASENGFIPAQAYEFFGKNPRPNLSSLQHIQNTNGRTENNKQSVANENIISQNLSTSLLDKNENQEKNNPKKTKESSSFESSERSAYTCTSRINSPVSNSNHSQSNLSLGKQSSPKQSYTSQQQSANTPRAFSPQIHRLHGQRRLPPIFTVNKKEQQLQSSCTPKEWENTKTIKFDQHGNRREKDILKSSAEAENFSIWQARKEQQETKFTEHKMPARNQPRRLTYNGKSKLREMRRMHKQLSLSEPSPPHSNPPPSPQPEPVKVHFDAVPSSNLFANDSSVEISQQTIKNVVNPSFKHAMQINNTSSTESNQTNKFGHNNRIMSKSKHDSGRNQVPRVLASNEGHRTWVKTSQREGVPIRPRKDESYLTQFGKYGRNLPNLQITSSTLPVTTIKPGRYTSNQDRSLYSHDRIADDSSFSNGFARNCWSTSRTPSTNIAYGQCSTLVPCPYVTESNNYYFFIDRKYPITQL